MCIHVHRYVNTCECVHTHTYSHTCTHEHRGLKLTSNDLDHILPYLFIEAESLTESRTLARQPATGNPFLYCQCAGLTGVFHVFFMVFMSIWGFRL